jgi:hypothetical protein
LMAKSFHLLKKTSMPECHCICTRFSHTISTGLLLDFLVSFFPLLPAWGATWGCLGSAARRAVTPCPRNGAPGLEAAPYVSYAGPVHWRKPSGMDFRA